MKFTVEKNNLSAALKIASNTLASKTGDDISAHFLFRVHDMIAEVLTYSGQTSTLAKIGGAEGLEDGMFTIEGKRLKSWVDCLGEGQLVFNSVDGVTTVNSSEGKQKFRSLDPQEFPFWNKSLDSAEATAQIEPQRFADVLNFAKTFASDQETSDPQYCVVDFNKGEVRSTNGNNEAYIGVVKGLEKAVFRIHVKTVSTLTTFLGLVDEIEILHNSQHVFFRSPDATLKITKAATEFQQFNFAVEEDKLQWTVDVQKFAQAVKFLQAGAAWEDTSLRIMAEEDSMLLSMKSLTAEIIDKSISFVSSGDSTAIPEKGMVINYPSFLSLLRATGKTEVPIVVLNGNKTFLKYVEKKENGDTHTVRILWRIK